MEKDANIKKMVELLLGRATMLAYHCPSCSAPLFEKEGKVLCPNCGEVKVVQEGEDEEKTQEPAGAEVKPQEGDDILKQKREELLLRLKDERDLRVILDILEAVRRIDGILRD